MLLFIFFLVLEVGVKLVDPLLIDTQEHDAVGVTALIVHDLELGQVHRISFLAAAAEDGPCLRVETAYRDCLRHAFE